MKKVYTLFCCLTIACLFFSCNKDIPQPATATSITKELSSQQYLSASSVPSIIFQVAFTNNETNKVNGFLIDNSGTIREFESAKTAYQLKLAEIISVTKPTLDTWIAESKAVEETLSIDDLAGYYKELRKVSNAKVSTRSNENASSITTSFFAYSYDHTADEDCGCKSAEGHKNTEVSYLQTPLRFEGSKLTTHNSSVAPKIVEWLQQMEIYEQLKIQATTL